MWTWVRNFGNRSRVICTGMRIQWFRRAGVVLGRPGGIPLPSNDGESIQWGTPTHLSSSCLPFTTPCRKFRIPLATLQTSNQIYLSIWSWVLPSGFFLTCQGSLKGSQSCESLPGRDSSGSHTASSQRWLNLHRKENRTKEHQPGDALAACLQKQPRVRTRNGEGEEALSGKPGGCRKQDPERIYSYTLDHL